MKKTWLLAGVALTGFALPALTQGTGVDPAEVKRLIAEHPAWGVWLSSKKKRGSPSSLAVRSQAGTADPGEPENAGLAVQCGRHPPAAAACYRDRHRLRRQAAW